MAQTDKLATESATTCHLRILYTEAVDGADVCSGVYSMASPLPIGRELETRFADLGPSPGPWDWRMTKVTRAYRSLRLRQHGNAGLGAGQKQRVLRKPMVSGVSEMRGEWAHSEAAWESEDNAL